MKEEKKTVYKVWVNWKKPRYFATFEEASQVANAYFRATGNMVAVTKESR